MLVLMRRENESIHIFPEDIPEGMTVSELFSDGPIEITIARIQNIQCKIGIDAPKELRIERC